MSGERRYTGTTLLLGHCHTILAIVGEASFSEDSIGVYHEKSILMMQSWFGGERWSEQSWCTITSCDRSKTDMFFVVVLVCHVWFVLDPI